MNLKKKILLQIRRLTMGLSLGVIFLAAELLFTNYPPFEYAAWTLAAGGLVMVSWLVDRAIRF